MPFEYARRPELSCYERSGGVTMAVLLLDGEPGLWQ